MKNILKIVDIVISDNWYENLELIYTLLNFENAYPIFFFDEQTYC